jgi:hypothetical protein
MPQERLQQTENVGAQRDPFLRALLGLRAVCARLDVLAQPAAETSTLDMHAEQEDDPAVLAALGLITLRRVFARFEQAALHADVALGASDRSVAPPARATVATGSLLR